MTRRDCHCSGASLGQPRVCFMQSLVNVNACVYHSVPVRWLRRDQRAHGREEVRTLPRGSLQIDTISEFFADLEQRVVRPVAKPIQHASVE